MLTASCGRIVGGVAGSELVLVIKVMLARAEEERRKKRRPGNIQYMYVY